MGWLDPIKDFVFGDQNQALNAQQKSNNQSREYTKEMADQARVDAGMLFNQSQEPLRQGYQAALDALGGTLKQQIGTTARGNYFGQEALLSGMPQFQNAILGYGVDNSQMVPKILHPERNLDWLFNQQLPETKSIDALSYESPVNMTPGKTTNLELIEQAYRGGLIDKDQYNMLIQGGRDNPNRNAQTNWSSAGSASKLIGKLGDNLSPQYRDALTTLFSGVYQDNNKPFYNASYLAGK